MPYHDGMHFGPWPLVMMAFMVLFWIVTICGIVWLVAYLARQASRTPGAENALDILNKRYARGEISKEEYERMKRDLADS